MDKDSTQKQRSPSKMVMCRRCMEGVRLTYQERLEELGTVRPGVCGLCGMESMVFGVNLHPKTGRPYRRQTGGGERRRAERTA